MPRPRSVLRMTRFQSTLLMRGATRADCENNQHLAISIHAPHARSDDSKEVCIKVTHISIHAPHARSDWRASTQRGTPSNFNPRSSCEERRAWLVMAQAWAIFQSTLLMRGATQNGVHVAEDGSISIHAPHARSDDIVLARLEAGNYFNPRSSCEERRKFMAPPPSLMHFNPRSSCEERLPHVFGVKSTEHISIHAPHARSDSPYEKHHEKRDISIHAPHARSDAARSCILFFSSISIHAPHARSE